MNKATEFDNWRRGGNHYVLRATADNKWVGFQESVISALKSKFEDDFYLVIWTNANKENDFYKIPFKKNGTDLFIWPILKYG